MPNATRAEIARLFARAGFGATAAELDAWSARTYEDAVSFLVDGPFDPNRQTQPDESERTAIIGTGEYYYETGVDVAGVFKPRLNTDVFPRAQRWWLERMRTTPYPLEERMTLFWHDHFATARILSELPNHASMLIQNETLRKGSLGSFGGLLEAVCLDPAMLVWLGGWKSQKWKPNENFARELMELFVLGAIPKTYEEADVKAAAKVFTGWTTDYTHTVRFDPGKHDQSNKTVLGEFVPGDTGLVGVEHKSLIPILLAHGLKKPGFGYRIAHRYLAWRLVQNFAYTPAPVLDAGADPLVLVVAAALDASGGDLRTAMRALLLHERFRVPDTTGQRQLLRSPIHVAASAIRALAIQAKDWGFIPDYMRNMGQVPFEPPDVAGWTSDKGWLTVTTLASRYSFGLEAHRLWKELPKPELRPVVPPATVAALPAWAALFGLDGYSPATTAAFTTYLNDVSSGTEAERQKGLVALTFTSPDWTVV